MKRTRSDDTLKCSFCHKHQSNVLKLVSSPSDYPRAYICDECIAVCNSILEDDRPDKPEGTSATPDKRDELHALLDDVPEAEFATVEKLLLEVIRRT